MDREEERRRFSGKRKEGKGPQNIAAAAAAEEARNDDKAPKKGLPPLFSSRHSHFSPKSFFILSFPYRMEPCPESVHLNEEYTSCIDCCMGNTREHQPFSNGSGMHGMGGIKGGTAPTDRRRRLHSRMAFRIDVDGKLS